jgi:hypothetical protein
VFSVLLYLGGLLLILILVNVVLVRTIRAEKRRQDDGRRFKRGRES